MAGIGELARSGLIDVDAQTGNVIPLRNPQLQQLRQRVDAISNIANWRQRRNGECLPSSAAMVMTYLGERVNYQRLLQRLGTMQSGTPFPNLDRLRSWRLTVERSPGNLAIPANGWQQDTRSLSPLPQNCHPIGCSALKIITL